MPSSACGRCSRAWETPTHVHIGAEPGSGQFCKVCNQMAIGGALAGVSEALAFARKAGVDPARVRQALLGGFAASRVLEVHGERMLTGNYTPGFRTRLYQKDLRIANETAAAHAIPIPATALVTQLVNALVASGGADLDYSAIGTVIFGMARSARSAGQPDEGSGPRHLVYSSVRLSQRVRQIGVACFGALPLAACREAA